MARDCFCGCGRKVSRQLKALNKRGGEIRFLAAELESHGLPVQEAYVLMSERGDGDAEELREASEGVATTREMISDLAFIQAQVAGAVHDDDPTLITGDLTGLKEILTRQNAAIRKLEFTVGLKYADIPGLGPDGIVQSIERQDRKERDRLNLS